MKLKVHRVNNPKTCLKQKRIDLTFSWQFSNKYSSYWIELEKSNFRHLRFLPCPENFFVGTTFFYCLNQSEKRFSSKWCAGELNTIIWPEVITDERAAIFFGPPCILGIIQSVISVRLARWCTNAARTRIKCPFMLVF